MKKTVLALSAALFCQVAFAQDLDIQDAWARATVGQPQSGAFMKITNQTDKDDVLVKATVAKAVAASTELHTHIHENGVMKMREVKDGIPVPAGQTQELKPGSYHIMFFGLKKPLKDGKKVTVTLTFKNGTKKVVHVPIRTTPINASAHQHHEANQHEHHEHKHAH